MEGAYKRLVDWSNHKGVTPKLQKTPSDQGWRYSITVSIESPVEYNATAVGSTIDDAAGQLIEELELVKAWEGGTPKNRFSFA